MKEYERKRTIGDVEGERGDIKGTLHVCMQMS
jgi:hypothetical protein